MLGQRFRNLANAVLRREPEPALKEKYQQWSIGLYAGESPWTLRPSKNAANPVITWADVSDVPAVFVADPFMIRLKHGWCMFFEVMNAKSGKGEIGYATSDNGVKWQYRQIVLTEPFHLSYPYVFEWRGDYYMIPESTAARDVRLYRAAKFPTQWSLAGVLLSGSYFADPSLFTHRERFWLFAETNPDATHDTLRLYTAEELPGPWIEHSRNPLVEGDPHTARPAGRVLATGERVVRFAQDCYPTYGTRVNAFEITELSETSYRERRLSNDPILEGSGVGWNACGMHHIDAHPTENGGWIACVDGFTWQA